MSSADRPKAIYIKAEGVAGASNCANQGVSCLLEAVRRVFAITVWLMCAASFATLCQAPGSTVYGYDLDGQPIRQLAKPGSQAVVLIFIATDCPISNRYAPEIRRLQKEFLDKQVAFWLVYPNATETAADVLKHQESFDLGLPTVIRPSGWLMTQTRASITPEAAVLVPTESTLKAVYAGRIDNRYVDIGREQPNATRHDLEEAVNAVLGHQPVVPAGGPPVGCGIVSKAALGKP